jgi:hypothetical protein
MRLPLWWRRSRFSQSWRCCDWCDHDRGLIWPEECSGKRSVCESQSANREQETTER